MANNTDNGGSSKGPNTQHDHVILGQPLSAPHLRPHSGVETWAGRTAAQAAFYPHAAIQQQRSTGDTGHRDISIRCPCEARISLSREKFPTSALRTGPVSPCPGGISVVKSELQLLLDDKPLELEW